MWAAKVALYSQSYDFPSSRVWMWELDHNESWVLKNWCFWTMGLEKTLESPWTARRSNKSTLKGIKLEYSFIGRTDDETEAPILWPRAAKSQLTGKDPDAGKDWGQERGQQTMRWLDGIIDSMNMSWSKLPRE